MSLLMWFWELNKGPLQGQHTLLTANPSVHPCFKIIFYFLIFYIFIQHTLIRSTYYFLPPTHSSSCLLNLSSFNSLSSSTECRSYAQDMWPSTGTRAIYFSHVLPPLPQSPMANHFTNESEAYALPDPC